MRPKRIVVILLESVAILWAGRSFSQIVLTEIMYNPLGNERYDEFIEVYNTSETDTTDLRDWLLSDGAGYNRICAHQQGTALRPLSHAVIFVPGYYQHSGYYDTIIPEEALRLSIDKSAFGSYGLNNTRSETVTLFMPDSLPVSCYAYSVPNAEGISEEKIILTAGDHPQNWRHSLVVNGTPGRRNSVSPCDYDLALEEYTSRIFPISADPEDSLSGTFCIHNRGMRQAENFWLEIFWDMNRDGTPQAAESLLTVVPSATIAPFDSLYCGCKLPPLPFGQHTFWAFVHLKRDENLANNSIELSVTVACPPPLLKLNECLPIPCPGYTWWIELFNADTVEVDLNGYHIEWSGMQEKMLLSPSALLLPPDHFILIAATENFQQNYRQPSCRVIVPEGLWPAAMTVPFSCYLLNETGIILDSLRWQKDAAPGLSIERLTGSQGWDYCNHPLGATPGARNSITAPYADAAWKRTSLSYDPNPPQMASPLHFAAWICNYGNLPVVVNKIACCKIRPQPFVPDTLLVQWVHLSQRIAPKDSLLFTYDSEPLEPGEHRFYFTLYADDDGYNMNDQIITNVTVPYKAGALIINELFYHTEEKQQEWIELYNPSPVAIDLCGCSIKDAVKKVQITDKPLLVPPGAYWVVCGQFFTDPANPTLTPFVLTALPELNNSGDQVVLSSPDGMAIDSVAYTSAWGGARFVSLERVRWEEGGNDPANWRSCVDLSGATPGRVNSCSPKRIDAAFIAGSLRVNPDEPYEGESVEVSCRIENVGRTPLSELMVEFYFRDFRETVEPLGSERLSHLQPRETQSVSIFWRDVPPGTNTVCCALQVTGDENDENDVLCSEISIGFRQSPVVINEIMYSPIEQQPEWIECYNRCSYSLNLSKWHLSDSDTLKKRLLTFTEPILPPQGYWIIAADSFNYQQSMDDRCIFTVLRDWPSLHNTADAVVLYDGAGRVIDRLQYTQDWGGARGRSLERLSPRQPAMEKTNWATCADDIGHTAGRQNSVHFDVLPSSAALKVSPVPFSPDGDGHEDHLAITCQIPLPTAYINLRIFDATGNPVRFLANYEHSGSERTIFWDGKDGDGQRCRMGIYLIHLQAFDERHGRVMQAKQVCVLALRL